MVEMMVDSTVNVEAVEKVCEMDTVMEYILAVKLVEKLALLRDSV